MFNDLWSLAWYNIDYVDIMLNIFQFKREIEAAGGAYKNQIRFCVC